NDPDDHRQDNCPKKRYVGQQKRERSRTENRNPDYVLTPELVANWPAYERSRRHSREKGKEIQLRFLYTHAELMHEKKGKITRHAGEVEVFRKDQNEQDEQRKNDGTPREYLSIAMLARCRFR